MPQYNVKPTIITEANIKMPRMFKVIMHNDNITEMDFVIDVLMNVFHKTREDAVTTMLDIHNNGHGIAGVYTYDIAVSKKLQTDRLSSTRGFPLKLSLDDAG
ncbi:MAG: ATP-dependent Clp protease adaptor ClpS [Defluviitaleaceae bacterium]|nr:ATP-dependent Clp protease adaptor ClpS [Defluviitaleaceae bacterium]